MSVHHSLIPHCRSGIPSELISYGRLPLHLHAREKLEIYLLGGGNAPHWHCCGTLKLVINLLKLKRPLQVTRRNVYLKIATEKETPTNRSILQWLHQFKKTNSLCKKKSSGRPSVSEEVVERVRQSFIRSPRECTRVAARELEIPKKNGMENFYEKN
ncbi:hypothetical protein TNCV_765561 [Trichonephila clavipes]|nr:hypothetical protein TNCV_765561 [Trichonephila clavipes]